MDYRRRRRQARGDERFGKEGSGSWVVVRCRVVRLLSDDNDGERHQRMIVDAGGRQTLLIAHNLDIFVAGISNHRANTGIHSWCVAPRTQNSNSSLHLLHRVINTYKFCLVRCSIRSGRL